MSTPKSDAVSEALAELVDAIEAEFPAESFGQVAQTAWAKRRRLALAAAREALAAQPAPSVAVPSAAQWSQLADAFDRWANSVGRGEHVTLTANQCRGIASNIRRRALAASPQPPTQQEKS